MDLTNPEICSWPYYVYNKLEFEKAYVTMFSGGFLNVFEF